MWLINFNPLGEVTDSLLFTWEELISGGKLEGYFREGGAVELSMAQTVKLQFNPVSKLLTSLGL